MKKIWILLLCFPFVARAQTANELVSQGNEFYKQTQFAQAEAAYRQALQADPANEVAAFNLANALQKQKKYEEATQVLEKLYGSSKDGNIKSMSAYNQGVGFTKLKNLESSIASYKNALRINPNDQQARENLQKALLELKKQQQDQKQQQQKSSSSMSEKDAEQKLKQLQEKERELQQKMQSQKKQQGGRDGRDW